MNADEIDPDVLLAALIDCIAEGLPNRDADVIRLALPAARHYRVARDVRQPVKVGSATTANTFVTVM